MALSQLKEYDNNSCYTEDYLVFDIWLCAALLLLLFPLRKLLKFDYSFFYKIIQSPDGNFTLSDLQRQCIITGNFAEGNNVRAVYTDKLMIGQNIFKYTDGTFYQEMTAKCNKSFTVSNNR